MLASTEKIAPPSLSADVPAVPFTFRGAPAEFAVEEVPAYTPSGEGTHLFVHFEKTGVGTPEAVKQLARALGTSERDAGYAGLKDRHAVTTQWASFAVTDVARALAIGDTVPGVRVLGAVLHGQKLRTGHLRGNRFRLVLRGVPASRDDEVRAVLARLSRDGVPAYFGEQRFGRDARNVERARAWILAGGPAPRAPFERKLFTSAFQSALFNEVLAERLRDGLFTHAVAGDLLRKEDTGGLFTTDDLADAEARVASFAVSPTGPMFGVSMRPALGEALAREEGVRLRHGLDERAQQRYARSGEGTRRALRLALGDATLERLDAEALELAFFLPAGGYATVVLREIGKGEEREAGL